MESPVAAAATVPPPSGSAPERRLSLIDTTSMIVGIIIGSGLYETTPGIAANVPGAAWLIGGWLLGGAFALVGSLCYAELTSAYPADGGDYVFLTRAFGRAVGFLFAWAQLWVIRPGSIGAMAYVFGRYATQLYPLGSIPLLGRDGVNASIDSFTLYAAAAVCGITAINILGVREGKWTQNALTAAKLVGLVLVVALGFAAAAAPAAEPVVAAIESSPQNLGLALILIVFTYGGWNDVAYVAAEVRAPERNILRALLLGVAAVAAVYVGVNLAFLHALGVSGVAASDAVAADVVALTLGPAGRQGIALLICISTLGAINGMIFTGARIYYALGRDHPMLALFGRWSPRFGTPVFSLTVQGLCTLAVVVGFGSLAADAASGGGFRQLINFTTPVFWCFLLLSGLSLFVLRWREPAQPRPFRVPLYPLIPSVFCIGAGLIVYSGVTYAIKVGSSAALWGGALMAVGLPLALLSRPRKVR